MSRFCNNCGNDNDSLFTLHSELYKDNDDNDFEHLKSFESWMCDECGEIIEFESDEEE